MTDPIDLDEARARRWRKKLLVGAKGKVISNVANGVTLLRSDPKVKRMLAYDEMLDLPMLMHPVPPETDPDFVPRPITDVDVTKVQVWLQKAGLVSLGALATWAAVGQRCAGNAYHPVRDYLAGLAWDGKERLDFWLHDYLDAPDDSYTRAIGAMFLIAMVARVMQPGCQVDHMLILEGPQGRLKSTACRVLGNTWFSDSLPDVVLAKDSMQHLRGKWLVEIAELSAINRAEASQLKAFVSRTVDRYRPTYGRAEVQHPRQCVFIGTTNEDSYLADYTGGRRFWPVKIGSPDIEGLRRDRDQLFAEAVRHHQAGKPWWPEHDFEDQHIAPQQEERFEVDPWHDTISDWLQGRTERHHRLTDIAVNALSLDFARLGTREARRIRRIMIKLGWKPAYRDQKGIQWEKTS